LGEPPGLRSGGNSPVEGSALLIPKTIPGHGNRIAAHPWAAPALPSRSRAASPIPDRPASSATPRADPRHPCESRDPERSRAIPAFAGMTARRRNDGGCAAVTAGRHDRASKCFDGGCDDFGWACSLRSRRRASHQRHRTPPSVEGPRWIACRAAVVVRLRRPFQSHRQAHPSAPRLVRSSSPPSVVRVGPFQPVSSWVGKGLRGRRSSGYLI